MSTLTPASPPKGLFKGRNFMTPEWIGYYKLRVGYAELSEGTGMSGQPIFGVTVRPEDGRSRLCFSRIEADDYIRSLS
jgi:hypothetical protein